MRIRFPQLRNIQEQRQQKFLTECMNHPVLAQKISILFLLQLMFTQMISAYRGGRRLVEVVVRLVEVLPPERDGQHGQDEREAHARPARDHAGAQLEPDVLRADDGRGVHLVAVQPQQDLLRLGEVAPVDEALVVDAARRPLHLQLVPQVGRQIAQEDLKVEEEGESDEWRRQSARGYVAPSAFLPCPLSV